MEIDRTSRRIVGALIEKRWTTPEQFPLTLNSLVAACNQKSNRDPEMQLEEPFIEGCLYQLRLEGLVTVVERDTGRATRYDERMSEKLGLSRPEQAVVAELLLRGPQTSHELFRRCERMAHFENAEQVEAILRGFASKGWTELLPREPGQRHARWRHLFAPAAEAAQAPERAATPESEATTATAPIAIAAPAAVAAVAASPAPPAAARSDAEIAALREEVAALRAEVAELRARLDRAP